MGAVQFRDTVIATSPREGFDRLVAEAQHEYGYDSYNGTISTCSMVGRAHYVFEGAYKESNLKKALKMVEDCHTDKRDAHYIDLGIVEYQLIGAKKTNTNGKPKYKLAYVVREAKPKPFCRCPKDLLIFDNKAEATQVAIDLAVQYDTEFNILKEYVLDEGVNLVTEVKLQVKKYKSKPKSVPKGYKLKEVHKYLFFGYAAE